MLRISKVRCKEQGKIYDVKPTPINYKGTQDNGTHGVWVCSNGFKYLNWWEFIVVEVVTNPKMEDYGYVYSHQYPHLVSGYWSSGDSSRLMYKARLILYNSLI